jgi:hypothetical protein
MPTPTVAAVLVWAAVEMARAVSGAGGLALPQMNLSAALTPAAKQVGWIVLALVLAWAGWKLARRFSA